MGLTREQILAARKDRKPHRFEVPEWGGEVFIRILSAKDQMVIAENGNASDTPVRVLVHSLVDEDGERLFTDEDFDLLADMDWPIIMRLFTESAKLNGLSTKELEEAVAGFTPAPDEFSSSE